MSSTGRSEHLRLQALKDEACPAWYACREPRPGGFMRVQRLPGQYETPEQAALDFIDKFCPRPHAARVWVWRGLFGARTVVRVLREETGELSACVFAADNKLDKADEK